MATVAVMAVPIFAPAIAAPAPTTAAATPVMPVRGKLYALAQYGDAALLGSRAELIEFRKGIIRRKIF
jgi:hypothetical protein